MTDNLTILTSYGPALAKRWTPDGIQPYDRAKHFDVTERDVNSLEELSELLRELEDRATSCVIRGRRKPDCPRDKVARTLENFEDTPHRWVCLDIDNVEGEPGWLVDPEFALQALISERLPAEFHNATFHWQLSNSAGAPGKEHLIKAHLWFWLDRPRTSAELTQWARSTSAPVDVAVFRPVQVHYTAAPIIEPGVVCPVIERSGLCERASPSVVLQLPPTAKGGRTVRPGRTQMVDPREKKGVIGAFCRAYEPARVIHELVPHLFAFEGDSDTRISWLVGDHAPGGLVITDDELHIHNSHGSDPLENGSPNAWDFARVHLFGELDEHLDPDALDWMGPAGTPSHAAMERYALELSDVVAELEVEAAERQQQLSLEAQVREQHEEKERNRRREHVETLRQGVMGCADVEALKDYCAKHIAGDQTIDDIDREGLLRPAVETRFNQITGDRLKRDLARQMVMPSRGSLNPGGGPDWLERWVFVTDTDQFYDLDRKQRCSRMGFDTIHSLKMPLSQDNLRRERASEWAAHVWGVRTVDNILYAPGQPEVFTVLGTTWANAYRPDSAPAMKEGGEEALTMVQAHLKRLFPHDRERGLLLSWLAHNVRYPGRKIRWAPYVYGPQGTGKTFLAELLGLTMGDANVRTLSGSTLQSAFTGWSTGAAVVAVEEVYQAGHLFETEEKLKAPIANNTIDVHRKGKDAYPAPNFTNYLLLSNHPDGMPVTEGDRRFFFLRVNLTAQEAEDLAKEGYWDSLFDTVRAAPGQLRQWLSSLELHEEFDPQGRAPKTAARAEVIELSRSDAEIALRDAIGETKAITAEWARAVLKAADIEPPKTRAWNALVARLGFDPVPRRPRVKGRMTRIYVHESIRDADNLVAVAALPKAVVDDFDDCSD